MKRRQTKLRHHSQTRGTNCYGYYLSCAIAFAQSYSSSPPHDTKSFLLSPLNSCLERSISKTKLFSSRGRGQHERNEIRVLHLPPVRFLSRKMKRKKNIFFCLWFLFFLELNKNKRIKNVCVIFVGIFPPVFF